MKKPAKLVVSLLLLAALGAGNMVAYNYSNVITSALCGTGENFSNAQATLQLSDELCRKVGEESIVMLRNENNALPLKEDVKTVNIFGWGATDDGFLLKGVGSGSSSINADKAVTLLGAFDEVDKNGKKIVDIEYNQDIIDFYNAFGSANRSTLRSLGGSDTFKLNEPNTSELAALIPDAQAYSDVAIFVISRCGGENIGDLPSTYLDISAKERATLELLRESFGTVIVLLNTTNTMHTGFLEEMDIDAAMYVGITGQSAAAAIPKILTGKVTPSGKLADTMPYSNEYDPTYPNMTQSGVYQYVEDIYFGYKWYETADVEGFFEGKGTTYEEVVQYPFGYGLSYTDFEWEVDSLYTLDESGENKTVIDHTKDVVLNEFDANTKIYLDVIVDNVGDYNGKDVVELFFTPEYTSGEVEKAAINLLDFVKTPEIEADGEGGTTSKVTLSFTPYDMASYDDYDKNGNGSATYELDEGDYTIKLMTDSHNEKDCEYSQINFVVNEDIIIDKDPATGETIENRFTGEGAYMGLDISALEYGATPYMTREDFAGTYPTKARNLSGVPSVDGTYYNDPYEYLPNVTTGEDNGLYLATLEDGTPATLSQLEGNLNGETLVWDYDLLEELMDYDSDTWDELLNQMSLKEMKDLIELGGFRRKATASVGLPLMSDRDGPAGFNTAGLTGDWSGDRSTSDEWTAFPSEALIGCSWNKDLMFELGRSMGAEADATKIDGWYAPGVNLHRNAYLGRNFEYYSEDGVLSGKLAANVIYGAKTNGLTCYLKHFVSSDGGSNPREANTWMTEQCLRETVLKPFEIAVKEGESNGIMSAFNNLGTIWCGANYALLTEVLRDEWGFRGTVLTDYMTSSSDGGMSVKQGIRAGNDIMLNPNNNFGGSVISTSDATDMKAARIACKNILYTTIDTEYTAYKAKQQGIDDIYQASGTIGFKEEVFAWWIPVLVALDIAIVLGLLVWTFKGKKDDKKNNKKNKKNSKKGKKGGKKRRA